MGVRGNAAAEARVGLLPVAWPRADHPLGAARAVLAADNGVAKDRVVAIRNRC